MTNRIYISGPITGYNIKLVQSKFEIVELSLINKKYTCYNPAWEKYSSWNEAMKSSITKLMQCDGIYMLNDWQKSKGAILERQIAKKVDIKVYYECDNDLNLK